MNVPTLEVSRQQATEAIRLYREHAHVQPTPADQEIERIYRQIAKGKKVIQAFASIRAAGLNADKLPKLAIVRADASTCVLIHYYSDRAVRFEGRFMGTRKVAWLDVPWTEGRPKPQGWSTPTARVPYIPVHLRPKVALDNYYILWEADWQNVPSDPMLLKRIGTDAWVVLAAWDLTPVELSVLRARVLAGKE